MSGDLLAEEHGGELADVGSLGGAEMLHERRDHLWVLRQTLYLLLRLPPGIVVRHQELYQQKLQRLSHFFLLCFSLSISVSVCCVFVVTEKEADVPVRVFGFCFALYLRVVFFLGGFVVWRIGQVFKNRSCTWDHCCVLGPPSTRGLCTDYRQYIMLAPFLFIFNTTLFLFFFGEK